MTTTITRHEDGTITQVGGVTRVQHGQLPPEDPASLAATPHTATRVGGKLTRFDGTTGGAETSSGFARHQHTQDRPNHGGSVMQTMRNEGGSKTVQLIPGDESSRTLLSVALRDGLVVESAPGIFTDRNAPGQTQQGANEAPQADDKAVSDDPLGGTIYDRGEFAIWNAETENIPAHSYSSAVAGVTAALSTANPAKLEGVISSLAQSAGMEPEQARELVETGVEWYAASISKDLTRSMGMTSRQVEAMYDSFRERGHPRLAEAMQQVAVTGRIDVFKELALDFKRKSAESTDMSAFTKAGYETRVDRDTGDIMVRLGQGPWRSLAQLAKGQK